MQQDMTNSFLKGIFNFRERERLLKFTLPRKMKLDWEELPFSLAEGRSYCYKLAPEIFWLSRLLQNFLSRTISSDVLESPKHDQERNMSVQDQEHNGKVSELWGQATWLGILILLLVSCVTMDKSCNLSVLGFLSYEINIITVAISQDLCEN